jgi:MFS family permease
MDLICEPQSEIGLLGACFFVGVILSIMWMPTYSDIHGRQRVMIATMVFQLSAQIGFVFTSNLRFACFLMMVAGMSHPGKNIVCLNYVMEIIPQRYT